jgi:hypothetical protein
VGLRQGANTKSNPCRQSILQIYLHGVPCNGKFHYRSIAGKLNFLEKGTRPDIAFATHQCVRFSKETRASHEDAAMWLIKYLLATKDDGNIYDPKREQSIEVYADADRTQHHRGRLHLIVSVSEGGDSLDAAGKGDE